MQRTHHHHLARTGIGLAVPRLRPLTQLRTSSGTHLHAGSSRQAETEQLRLSGDCYEDIVQQLAERALALHERVGNDLFEEALGPWRRRRQRRRATIGIAGAPGSGKSTLAALVAQRINAAAAAAAATAAAAAATAAATGAPGQPSVASDSHEVAIVLPMDGFHLYRSQLDAMPDPEEAHRRRGAPWTFDVAAFTRCVWEASEEDEVHVPSFDHARGDPVEGDLVVRPYHKIVLVEGNYVLLDATPWDTLKLAFEDTWFVDVDLDVAMQRVFERQTAIGLDPEVSRARIASNDRPNGLLVQASKKHARVLVPSSIPFRASRPQGS